MEKYRTEAKRGTFYILIWITAFFAGAIAISATDAKIHSISHSEISALGYQQATMVWESGNSIRYQIQINRPCDSFTNAMQASAGRHESIVNAVDLVSGRNEIRICIEDRGERGEVQANIYRDDTLPVIHAFPEPAEWNGTDSILLNCTNCASMKYSLGNEQTYAGPLAMPAEGARLTFYAVSAAGVKSEPRSLEYDRKEHSKPWRSGRAQIAPLFMATTGELRDVLPSGWGGMLSYEQGPDGLLSAGRAWYIPGARAELGVLYFAKQESREVILPVNVGPIWEIAPIDRHTGRFFFAGLIGVTYISAVAGDFSRSALTTDMQFVGGYRLPWENFALRAAGRYLVFFDKSLSLTGFGGEIGFEYVLF